MNGEVSKNVDEVLGVLAERFGSTAEQLWDVMVSYHYVVGLCGTIACGLAIAVLIGIGLRGIKLARDDDDWLPMAIIPWIAAGLVTLPLCIEALPRLLCPAMFALREIAGTL